jgi:hypothetical protein
METIKKALDNKLAPYLVLLAATGFLLVLLSTIQPDVFFSGDGGLKYLIVKQLDQSGTFNHIVSTHPTWVEDAWKHGYYPFQPPFAYEFNNEHMITFPVFFSFLSSFFYGQFGYYGLYIIPAISVFLTWVLFLSVLTELKVRTATKTVGLFLLAFCTPLTFYGAVFWEHSLATFLLLNGFIYFIREKSKLSTAFLSGILAGMAIWFREETIILLALVMLVIAWRSPRFRSKPDFFFLAGTLIPILFYFIFNSIVFDRLFGLHGHQIVAESNLPTQIWKGLKQFVKLNVNQLIHFPFITVFYIILFFVWKRKDDKYPRLFQLGLIVLLFTLVVPFFLPSAGDKQWGPRFFLSVIPAVMLVLAIFADKFNWWQILKRDKLWILLSAMMIAYSFFLNVYLAGKELHRDYNKRVLPALKYIDAQPCPNIIVDNQYIVQELTERFNNKNFFLLPDEAALLPLLARLKAAGQQQCIFIAMNKDRTSIPLFIRDDKRIDWKHFGTSYLIGVYDIP